jgi:flagellar hook-associated protein 1 FlgK
MTGILGTALSGLMAFQRSLDTTSHNIANVNTEGYSRQRVELNTQPAQYTGAGYMGQGVNIAAVSRGYDQFINSQLTSSTSAFAETHTLSTLASQVDNTVADDSTGLSPALKAFFNAVNGVANDPSSVPARQVMTSEAQSLTHQFTTLSAKLESLRNQTNSQMQGNVDDINTFADNLAALNGKILVASGRTSGGHLPNDLMDQRDVLLNKIAQKIGISSTMQPDGSVSVFIANGQPLVMGAVASKLSLTGTGADSSHKAISIRGQNISRQITGGELSGALKFRDDILDPAQQQLGLVAAGFAVQFNAVQTAGFDLNGTAGTALFDLGTVSVVAASGSTGSISAAYDPAGAGSLNAGDYRLDYNGTAYSLTRLSDNAAITLPASFPGTPAAVEGMTLAQAAPPTGASSFIIRPTFDAAKKLTVVFSDPLKIAAAGSNSPGPPVAAIPGDNTNALRLADLEKKAALLGGKATLNDAYGQLVAKASSSTHAATISSSAQQVLLNQATQSRENLAGVNLDEEAANLIKFQQSYQAAAQVVSVARSLFDTLIGATR